MKATKHKLKTCKVCPNTFKPWSTTEIVCSLACAIKHSEQMREKKYKAETRKMKKDFRATDRSYHIRKAQASFNKFIRLRDGQKCISCGNQTRQMQSGHYLSIGSHPELRFHPWNSAAQCTICNNFKSGNQKNYRENLVIKIGLANVEWLEGPHERYKLTLDDIKDINQYYKQQVELIDR